MIASVAATLGKEPGGLPLPLILADAFLIHRGFGIPDTALRTERRQAHTIPDEYVETEVDHANCRGPAYGGASSGCGG